jgi:hypothetical protein
MNAPKIQIVASNIYPGPKFPILFGWVTACDRFPFSGGTIHPIPILGNLSGYSFGNNWH